MEYTLFFDTNALLNLQDKAFMESFIISQKTLEEIENIKSSAKKDSEIKYKARIVARLLDENDGTYEVVPVNKDVLDIINTFYLEETPDNIILASAYYKNNETPVLVVSDDVNVKFISRNIFGLKTKGINDINLVNVEEYTGFKEVVMTESELESFYANSDKNTYDLLINQYLIILDKNGETLDAFRWSGEKYETLYKKQINTNWFDKIKPKDIYQVCAIDSLMNTTVTAISGGAGSGKSLLSLMAAMSLIENSKTNYERIVVMFNPTKAKGASELGFYSGDFTEKAMQNSIGQVLTTKFGDRLAVDLLISQNKLKLVSMADCRGMEISDREILWITEAQNTSSDLIKLCLSRVSSGAKVFVEGDYNSQVDSYLFDGSDNGLKHLIDVFKNHEEFGYVQLQNVWRSKIAELCELL